MNSEVVKGVVLFTHAKPNNRAVASYLLAKAIKAKPDEMLGKVKAGDLIGKRVEILPVDPLDPKPVVDYLETHPDDTVVIDPHVVFPQDVFGLAQRKSVEITGRVFSLSSNLLNYGILLDFGFASGIGEFGPEKSWNPLYSIRPDKMASFSLAELPDPEKFLAMVNSLFPGGA